MTNGYDLRKLVVGEPYADGETAMPDGAHVDITPTGIELRLSFANVSESEVRILTHAPFSLRLLNAPRTMMFLTCFGDGRWSEAPFNVHRIPEEQRVLPAAPATGFGFALTLVVVDAATGIVRGLRQLALTQSFSLAILRAMQKQIALSADDEAHLREVARMQGRSTTSLASDAIDRFETGAAAN